MHLALQYDVEGAGASVLLRSDSCKSEDRMSMYQHPLCVELVNLLGEKFLELKFWVCAHLLKQTCTRMQHSEP